MAQATLKPAGRQTGNPKGNQIQQVVTSPAAYVVRLILLGIVDVIAIQMAIILGRQIGIALGIGVILFTVIANIVFLDERLFQWRWVIPAATGMALLIIYPMGYSLLTAFTNRGTGHTEDKAEVVAQLQSQYFSDPTAAPYQFYVYTNQDAPSVKEDFVFFVKGPNGEEFKATGADTALTPLTAGEGTTRDSRNIPTDLNGYGLVATNRIGRLNTTLQRLAIQVRGDVDGESRIFPIAGSNTLKLIGGFYESRPALQKYTFDEATNTMKDNETGFVYQEEQGTFVYRDGERKLELQPGFVTYIGLGNISRVIDDPNVRDPFLRVFGWTIVFALGSVFSTFAIGLLLAMILNTPNLPFRPIWRSLLIIPYAIPFWLSAVTWRGLLNPIYGQVSLGISAVTGGFVPPFFSDPTWAKVAILLVNLYLGFPYMMLICLGALQSIPSDMYEAATIDGANDLQQFRFITLPLLLVAVGPLLIASFAFNFNNFTLIELLTSGGPPISASTVAGHTDILLSYTYRLAFAGTRGNDLGFAAAIGIFIFLIVGTITFFNFRFTRQLEKVSE